MNYESNSRRNLFILGSGRSGTSMVAGMFRNAGYFMGANLHEPRASNPLGFFEDAEVNNVNEAILAPYMPSPTNRDGIIYGCDAPSQGQRWLARLPPNTQVLTGKEQLEQISRLTSNRPFCFKDPRFAYTLQLWRPYGGDCRFVCVFRDPAEVVESILTECRTTGYLHNFAISVEQAAQVWLYNYRSILEKHAHIGDWFYIRYEQAFEPECVDRLEAFSSAKLDRNFPTRDLKRTTARLHLGEPMQNLYEELCRRAEISAETKF